MNILLVIAAIFIYIILGVVMAMFVVLIGKYHCGLDKPILKGICILTVLAGPFSLALIFPIMLFAVCKILWDLIDEEWG